MDDKVEVIDGVLAPDLRGKLEDWAARRAREEAARGRPRSWTRRLTHGVRDALGLEGAGGPGWRVRLAPTDAHNLADISFLLARDEATRPAAEAWSALCAVRATDGVLVGCELIDIAPGSGQIPSAIGDGQVKAELALRLDVRRLLVFHTRRRRSQDFEALSTFLVQHGALGCDHYVGTLHDHLMRGYDLLAGRGAPHAACLGAGLHSIYGTNLLDHRMLDHADRGVVRAAFGEDAERLAYQFSILDRPRALAEPLALDAASARLALSDGDSLEVSRREFDDLRWMECANLADQDTLTDWPALSAFWAR